MFYVAVIQAGKLTGALVLQCSNQREAGIMQVMMKGLAGVFVQENWSEGVGATEPERGRGSLLTTALRIQAG